MLDLEWELFNDPLFLFDYIHEIFHHILILADFFSIPFTCEMLNLVLQIINKFALFGKFNIQRSYLGMGIDYHWYVCSLLMLDQEILKLFNSMEQLYCWVVIHVSTMDEIIWEELSIAL